MEKGRIPGIKKIWYASFRNIDVRIKEYTNTPTARINLSMLNEIDIVEFGELETESNCELNQTIHPVTIEFMLIDNPQNRLVRDYLLSNNKSIVYENHEGEKFLLGGSEPPFPSFVCQTINKKKERYLRFEMSYLSDKSAILCI